MWSEKVIQLQHQGERGFATNEFFIYFDGQSRFHREHLFATSITQFSDKWQEKKGEEALCTTNLPHSYGISLRWEI